MPASANREPEALDAVVRTHLKRITVGSGSSFYWGMRLQPETKRNGMFAIYAFCRHIDDIADASTGADIKLQQLEDWRQTIAALCDRNQPLPERPGHMLLMRALRWAIVTFDLPEQLFQDLILGMEMDLTGKMQAPDWNTLHLYNYRVAGVVGLLSIRIFGDTGRRAEEFALALANALQLTNILRDLREDATMGRLYLPAEELAAHGIPAKPIDAVLSHARLDRVCHAVAAVAREHYAEAGRLIHLCDRRALRPARVMMHVYNRIFDRLVMAGWDDLDRTIGLSRWEKLRAVASGVLAR